MAQIDRCTARALVDAGFMPLSAYVEIFGHDAMQDAPLVPQMQDDPHDSFVMNNAEVQSSRLAYHH